MRDTLPFRPRRADLDRGKGLAILLVVFGHIVATATPAGVGWYEPARHAVYAVHMPFFVYLSGFAAAVSGAATMPARGWPALMRKRLVRPLLPAAIVGVLIVIGKYAAQRTMHVDDPVGSLTAALADLVWRTGDSAARSIWYAYVIVVYAALMPPAYRLGRSPALLAAFAALLALCPLPAIAYLDDIGQFAVFYCLGVWAGLSAARWTAMLDRHAVAFMTAGPLILACFMLLGGPPRIGSLAMGAACLPALHALVRKLGSDAGCGLQRLGRHTFMIYLFNTICIGLTKALLCAALPWDARHFPVFAATLMAAGLFGPILLKRHAFRPFPLIDRLTD